MSGTVIDCFNVLHTMHLVTPDACASARATIRAAELQAKATRYAAELTVFAALAGIFAVFSAWLQSRLVARDYIYQVKVERSILRDRLIECERSIANCINTARTASAILMNPQREKEDTEELRNLVRLDLRLSSSALNISINKLTQLSYIIGRLLSSYDRLRLDMINTPSKVQSTARYVDEHARDAKKQVEHFRKKYLE